MCVGFYHNLISVCFAEDRLCGAVLCAGAALNALLRVNCELAFYLFDCLCGAILLAGAALDSVGADAKCHNMYLL